MDKASEALFSLKPVTFRYKKEIDPAGTSQFGLVAEDVEKISPDLVVRDEKGVVNTVRYDQVNAMLLNEFLKEHHKVQRQSGMLENPSSQDSRSGNDDRRVEERNGNCRCYAQRAGITNPRSQRADWDEQARDKCGSQ